MTPKPQPGDACALENALNFRFRSCYQTLGEYFSTPQPFWIRGSVPTRRSWDSSLVNRLSSRGLPLQHFNLQTHNEILHTFNFDLLHRSDFTACTFLYFRSNAGAHTQGAPK